MEILTEKNTLNKCGAGRRFILYINWNHHNLHISQEMAKYIIGEPSTRSRLFFSIQFIFKKVWIKGLYGIALRMAYLLFSKYSVYLFLQMYIDFLYFIQQHVPHYARCLWYMSFLFISGMYDRKLIRLVSYVWISSSFKKNVHTSFLYSYLFIILIYMYVQF